MKNILTILLFLLFLTSPLIIQYNGTEPQFQGKVQAKEQCEEDDEDCEEEGEENSDDETVTTKKEEPKGFQHPTKARAKN